MAGRKKSVASKLIDTYQQRLKQQAAERKRAEAAARKLADQERRAQAAAEKKAQQQEAARKRKEEAGRARAVAAAVKGLDRREAQRAQEAVRQQREQTRTAAQAERDAKQAALEQFHSDATRQTDDVRKVVDYFDKLLLDRKRELQHHRLAVESGFDDGDAERLAAAVRLVLFELLEYRQGGANDLTVGYAPERRELGILVDLPKKSVVPAESAYRYMPSRKEVVADLRKDADKARIYRDLTARYTLRTLDYAFAITAPSVVDTIALYGHVHAKDPGTGRAIHPLLLNVQITREEFEELNLDEVELDPSYCLRRLNALVSVHPYDLEEVMPVIKWDISRYKTIDEMDVIGGLDSRSDLLAMKPNEFEHLVRQLVEAMGLEAWVTQSSRDDGVDGVARLETPLIGGMCIIQAKRYKDPIPVEAVRALAGSMHDMNAIKGIVVATSWFGKASIDFATRSGRIELIDGRNLKALLKQHLGLDVLIGLPTIPAGWNRSEIS